MLRLIIDRNAYEKYLSTDAESGVAIDLIARVAKVALLLAAIRAGRIDAFFELLTAIRLLAFVDVCSDCKQFTLLSKINYC